MKALLNPYVLVALIVYLFFSLSLLLEDPLVWPDEAIYGDIAKNLMLENRMGTDLWKGLINGIENHAYSLPPFYLYLSSLWFKIFGFTITTQRLLSVFLGVVFLSFFYLISKDLIISKKQTIKKFLPIILTLLVAIDSVFLKTSRLGRPEALVLVLIFSAVIFFLKAIESKNINKIYLFCCALLLGFTITTHLIAINFALAFTLSLIIIHKKKALDFKLYFPYILGLFIPIAIWLLLIFPNYNYLFDQLNLVRNSRDHTIPWYSSVLNATIFTQLNYLIYICIGIFFTLFTLKRKKSAYILITSIIVSSWIFASLGQLHWYTIYPISFSYLALLILINHFLTKKVNKARLFLIAVASLLFFSHLANFYILMNFHQGKPGYQEFKNQVLGSIPSGKSVYLTAIPDAYYAFPPGRNTLIEFPALFENMDNYKQVLRKVDFIIFNGAYIPNPQASDYLDKYIAKNIESHKEILNPYPVIIFKMKPADQREAINE